MKRSPLRKKSKDSTKQLAKKLYELSHTYIRKRDSINNYEIGGYCVDCGTYACGGNFQAGHFVPDGACGALGKYHPHNMHGQAGQCNASWGAEKAKIGYTFFMINKYGEEYVQRLRRICQGKTIKADSIFYNKMIELYEKGDEQEIIKFLESKYIV